MKLFFSTVLLFFCAMHWALAERLQLIYNGDFVDRATIETRHGTDYISIQDAATLFKAQLQRYPISKKITLSLNNHKITFAADNKTVDAGSKNIKLSAPVIASKKKFLVPLNFFLSNNFKELSDCSVILNEDRLEAKPSATLFSPRVYSRNYATKIMLQSSEEMDPELTAKKNILTLTIPKARIAANETTKINDALISEFSLKSKRKDVILTIVLKRPSTNYSLLMEKNPTRAIIEIPNPNAKTEDFLISTETEIDTENLAITPSITKPKKTVAAWTKPKPHVKKIVVDAGHGGKDPGAIGSRGTKEKDINLAIALDLAKSLELEGYEIILTRSDDTFIPLHERTSIANRERADLFISVHCNASIKRKQKGFEIYFLSDKASDAHAEETEHLENSVVTMEESQTQNKNLESLLFSMAQNEFMNESSLLCHTISDSVRQRVDVQFLGVKQANFHVLHGAQMPSILIENGFVTESGEEKKLCKKQFRNSMVDAVISGVHEYERKLRYLQ